ncbi:MAG: twin-arginine translocase TatA/TatE family subunit [Chloroflexi bacterium]|nr:twin-arginine translocase TatA/TatE family subunit [Chloroflexota bacterium]
MFGIGTGEILLILIITMLVVGPERMVQLAGQMGRMLAKLRQETDSMTQEFRDALNLEEMQEVFEEAKKEAGEIGEIIEGTAKEVQEAAGEVNQALQAPGQALTPTGRLPTAATAAVSLPSGLAAQPADAGQTEQGQETATMLLFLEGELEIEEAPAPSPYGLSAQLEEAAPVLIHTALLVPEDRDPEEVELEAIEPTPIGPLVVEEETQEPAAPSNGNEPEAATNADLATSPVDGEESAASEATLIETIQPAESQEIGKKPE